MTTSEVRLRALRRGICLSRTSRRRCSCHHASQRTQCRVTPVYCIGRRDEIVLMRSMSLCLVAASCVHVAMTASTARMTARVRPRSRKCLLNRRWRHNSIQRVIAAASSAFRKRRPARLRTTSTAWKRIWLWPNGSSAPWTRAWTPKRHSRPWTLSDRLLTCWLAPASPFPTSIQPRKNVSLNFVLQSETTNLEVSSAGCSCMQSQSNSSGQ